jgi:subtilisin family serine protease
VTGVDPQGRVLPEAGHGAHVDFAAPGSQMAAAGPAGGLVAVRGTSFAAPIVAGELALRLTAPDPARARAAIDDLGRQARHPPQGETGLGRGIVGADLRTPPPRR